jgi:hypothetical protein
VNAASKAVTNTALQKDNVQYISRTSGKRLLALFRFFGPFRPDFAHDG